MASSSERSSSPADGERRAVRSLSAQYRVAAQLTIEALSAGELEWIRLVDPDAGRLDDILIARAGRLDAYQIKWSEYQGSITLRELVKPSSVASKTYPAPFELMADGWRRLSGDYPERQVRAHFLTRSIASIGDGDRSGIERTHLQAFMRHAFQERTGWKDPANPVHAVWSSRIALIQEATLLPAEEFAAFIGSAELNLGYTLVSGADIDLLAQHFVRLVSDGSGVVERTAADIIRDLGWTDRWEFRFRHEFPVDERLYQPIEATVADINRAINQFDRGYLALVGPPGAGKSTTLTQTLRYRRGIRLIRYYAFVRDDPRLGRGEAITFLHDLCLALEGLGFRSGSGREAFPTTTSGLRDRLAELLQGASEAKGADGIKTVILIDGLDHIHREQTPERSLVEELPPPAALPDGVLVVLGTQASGLRTPSNALGPVLTQLAERGRTLDMARMGRTAVHSFAREIIGDDRLGTHLDEVFRLSGGHPLSLAYLMNRLVAAVDAEAVGAILAQSEDFGGDVEGEYGAHWRAISQHPALVDLLGLLARNRHAVQEQTIKSLAAPEVVAAFVGTSQYLFRQLRPRQWAFFHNSFRQFVVHRTGRDAFGSPDASLNAAFHRRLAEHAGSSAALREFEWERLYHLEQSDGGVPMLALAQQDRFRQQFLAGRPWTDISDDIQRCMEAAATSVDARALVRLMLIKKEISDRVDALDHVDVEHISLSLCSDEQRPAVLMAGDEVAVSYEVALQWSVKLFEQGDRAFAAQLFSAAEPVDLLAGTETTAFGQASRMDAWIDAAWRFRPLRQVIDALSQVRASSARWHPANVEDDEDDNDEVRLEYLVKLGRSIHDAGDLPTYRDYLAAIEGHPLEDSITVSLDFGMGRRGADNRSTLDDPIEAMQRAIVAREPQDLNSEYAAWFADVLVRLPTLEGYANSYLDQIQGPLSVRSLDSNKEAFDPLEPLFRQARASAARGRPMDPLLLVDPDQEWDKGRVLLQRLVIVVATLWGKAIAGQTLSPTEFARRIAPVLAFRQRSAEDLRDWHDWYQIKSTIVELVGRMLAAAQAHGPEVYEAALSATLAEWRKPRQSRQSSWEPTEKRRVALAAYRLDGDVERTRTILLNIDQEQDWNYEVEQQLTEMKASAEAWIEIGHSAAALAIISDLKSKTFGVSHGKDGQAGDWAKWFERLQASDAPTSLIVGAGRRLLSLCAQLYSDSRGRGAGEAVSDIVASLAGKWPGYAAELAIWLLDHGLAPRQELLARLLALEIQCPDGPRRTTALVVAARLHLPFHGADSALDAALKSLATTPNAPPGLEAALAIVRNTCVSDAQAGEAYLATLSGPDLEEQEGVKPMPSMNLTDGRKLQQGDVEQLASQPADLIAILLRGQHSNSIRWSKLITDSFAIASPQQRQQIAEAVLKLHMPAPDLETLAGLAAKAGLHQVAEIVLERILAMGKSYGWIKFYDRGSRWAAARVLRAIDTLDGTRRTLELFTREYASLSPGEVLIGSVDLLEALVGSLPVVDIWPEIEEHLSMLLDMQQSPHEPPDFQPEGSCLTAIAPALLLHAMSSASPGLSLKARICAVDLFELGLGHDLVADVTDRLGGTDLTDQFAALALLRCLSWKHPQLCTPFVDTLQNLAVSESGLARLAARQSLRDLGLPSPTMAPKPVPGFYQLYLPRAKQAETGLRGELAPPGQPLVDTDDPFDLTRLHFFDLERLEELTNYSRELLTNRVVQIMRRIAPPEMLRSGREHAIQNQLRAVGLSLAYRRPRALVAQYAYGYLVAELCDCGALDWLPARVKTALEVADPPVNLAEPSRCPEWLGIPDAREIGAYPVENWLASVNDALSPAVSSPDGWTILAETTMVENLERDRATEYRVAVISALAQPFRRAERPDTYALGRHQRYFGSDYPQLVGFDQEPTVAVAGGAITARAEFLALNPSLGAALGWQPAKAGLFRWIDGNGDVMAESIHWCKGNVDVREDYSLSGSAGDGWIVVASRSGWTQMKPLLPHFSRHRLSGRTPNGSSDERLVVVQDCVPLP